MTEQVLPCNIESTDADQQRAKLILKDDTNYIVRYLRHQPTVGLAKLPARNADGAIIVDAPAIRKRVICAGVPYACMIAFMYQDKLLVGWSKRIETRRFIETQELHGLFRHLLENTDGVTEHSDNYQGAFNAFATRLTGFLCCQGPKEVEMPFSKVAGKTAAVIRGLNDCIIIKGKYLESHASGPIPGEIARSLPQFIEFAEQTYGGKAANVGTDELLPVEKQSADLAVV